MSSNLNLPNQDVLNAALAERPIDKNTFGVIDRNDNTEQHGATLQELGYEVIPSEDSFAVKGRFLRAKKSDVIDLSDISKAVGFLRAVVANKRLIGYNQRCKMPNGKVLFRGPVLRLLGHKRTQDALGFNPTALIAKKGKIQEPKKAAPADPWAVQPVVSAPPSVDPFGAPAPAPQSATPDPFSAPQPAADPFAAPAVSASADPFAV